MTDTNWPLGPIRRKKQQNTEKRRALIALLLTGIAFLFVFFM